MTESIEMESRCLPATSSGEVFMGEIWALKHQFGHLVPAIDDDGAGNFLAFFSEEDAKRGADHQNELYEAECEPVRII